MILMSENRGTRTYLGNDEVTWYEVRAEMRCQSRTVSQAMYDIPGLRSAAEKETIRDLERWFKETGKAIGAVPLGEVTSWWDPIRVVWEEGMKDQDGHPVPVFAPFTVYRITAEQGYWPPAPVDPDPDPLLPPPRSSDFRGDRFA